MSPEDFARAYGVRALPVLVAIAVSLLIGALFDDVPEPAPLELPFA